MPDGSVKYVHAVAHASRDKSGGIEFVQTFFTEFNTFPWGICIYYGAFAHA